MRNVKHEFLGGPLLDDVAYYDVVCRDVGIAVRMLAWREVEDVERQQVVRVMELAKEQLTVGTR